MYKVLLVDDEQEILIDRSQIIASMGFKCYTAQNSNAAIHILYQKNLDVVFTDMKMPGRDGFYLLKAVKEYDPYLPVILFTGYGTIELAVKAMKLGAYDYIQKPVSKEMMELVLNKAIDYRRSTIKPVAVHQLDNVIGKSKAISEVAERVHRVAKSDANILIYGESGTGKELIARSIHQLSNRKDKPFIPLDCVALPGTLLESELFGFEQGAFTGAVRTKPGMIELADGGTLFLDEIVELEPNLQAKLLRVLQERQFRRIGGTKLITTNVRIISATNRHPEEAVNQKILRQDLYFRLNVVPIFIPPLRERKEDIPLLVHYFIKKFNISSINKISGIDNEALKCLKNYDWPGNVRELQNVIEQTIALTDHNIITVTDLPDYIKYQTNTQVKCETYHNLSFKEAKEQCLNRFYYQYLNSLLKKYNGNISKVAREAGISRKTIYRMLENM